MWAQIGVISGAAALWWLKNRAVIPGPDEPDLPFPDEDPLPDPGDLPRTDPMPLPPVEPPTPSAPGITDLSIAGRYVIPAWWKTIHESPRAEFDPALFERFKAEMRPVAGTVSYVVGADPAWQFAQVILRIEGPTVYRTFRGDLARITMLSGSAWNLATAPGTDERVPGGEIRVETNALVSVKIGRPGYATVHGFSYMWLTPGTYTVESYLKVTRLKRYAEGWFPLSDKLIEGPKVVIELKEG